MGISEQLIKTFTPTGKLRASINLGNPILVNRRPETGEPYGVSIDLAHAFAQRLGAEQFVNPTGSIGPQERRRHRAAKAVLAPPGNMLRQPALRNLSQQPFFTKAAQLVFRSQLRAKVDDVFV